MLKSLKADVERQTQQRIEAAVITVPAAFGSLQCDATARAAQLAGFKQSPLLQEPIAAAVAYGASPAAKDQRWMVFDLGGGTLDIAIVSTRNGKLTVLDHQGNNRLGGKDIDRMIVDALLLPRLQENFHLPDPKTEGSNNNRLLRSLLRHAEQAKIALSTADEVEVDLFELGDDVEGRPIEASFTLKRAELESAVQSKIDECLDLCRRALEGARVASSDLDRVLLVGGPTQMPVLRSALKTSLGAKLDYSLDPMTVVAQGAALYASTIEVAEKSQSSLSAAGSPTAKTGVVRMQLSHERASGTIESPLVGILDAASGVEQVKVDAAGGFWTSGWVPVVDGSFQMEVRLQPSRPATNFTVSARDGRGNSVLVEPATFTIAYMLPMGAPPLPHAIAIELSTTHGVTRFDPLFKRHTPLPAETRKSYRTDRPLRPSEVDSTLPIKFWEIEVSDDPQERWWAGCVHLRASVIKRPLPEGTELELLVKIDTSRKMTVELFVPLLNLSFKHNVYVPDPPSTRSQLQQQLDLLFERLMYIQEEIYGSEQDELLPQFQQLQLRAEAVAEQFSTSARQADLNPDDALRPTDELRKLRVQMTHLEEQLGIGSGTQSLARQMRWQVRYIDRVVQMHGTQGEAEEFEKLKEQYSRFAAADDSRGLHWVREQLWILHWGLVRDQMWFWQNRLETLRHPQQRFVNRELAAQTIQEAEAANARRDLPALRSACSRAWELISPDHLEAARDRETQSGLRGL